VFGCFIGIVGLDSFGSMFGSLDSYFDSCPSATHSFASGSLAFAFNLGAFDSFDSDYSFDSKVPYYYY
jgi:hypothetical protein